MKAKFKVGDKVRTTYNTLRFNKAMIGKVVLVYSVNNRKRYNIKCEDGVFRSAYSFELEHATKIENNQPITHSLNITLETAKQWYKAGGELKTIALQVFKECELKDRPKSWEEYCDTHNREGFFIDCDGTVEYYSTANTYMYPEADKTLLKSKEIAERFIAYMQLISLRQDWIGNWEPDWSKETAHKNPKYCIVPTVSEGFSVEKCHNNWIPTLSFPTKEMAQEFLDCFRDILEQAKGLY